MKVKQKKKKLPGYSPNNTWKLKLIEVTILTFFTLSYSFLMSFSVDIFI